MNINNCVLFSIFSIDQPKTVNSNKIKKQEHWFQANPEQKAWNHKPTPTQNKNRIKINY